VGIGPESGDLSFPDYSKMADAFGFPYIEAHSNEEMKAAVNKALKHEGFVFCEIFTDTIQGWEPKNSAKKLADGTLFSAPLEDLAPFLSEEELKENMYIPLLGE
jgi:acetolactate synthase-1/2/3 large subunit